MLGLNNAPSRLVSLPPGVILDLVFPLLTAKDLCSLRLVSNYWKSLVDDEVTWRRRIAEDYNFPLQASARVSGWQQLYRGLSRPNVFVWGQAENRRLGIEPREIDEKLGEMIRDWDSAPFPLKVNYKQARQAKTGVMPSDVGAPVKIVAGGWSFHVLTSQGEVLFWGTLDGDVYWASSGEQDLANPHIGVQSPQVLCRAGLSPIRSVAGGRKHAIALTEDKEILEWHSWDTAVRHEPLWQTIRQDERMHVAQLEAGWDFTVALLHHFPRSSLQASRLASEGPESTLSEVIYWHKEWVSRKEAVNGMQTWLDVRRISLPALPEPSLEVVTELASASGNAHRTIAQVAAGEDFVIALTLSGLVYKLDVAPVPHVGELDGDLGSTTHPATLLARSLNEGSRRWELMEHFCLPSRIARLSSFTQDQRLAALVTPATRIAHISAQFRTWAAYTNADFSHSNAPEADRPFETGGIVLLGKGSSIRDTGPIVMTELQGTGVIKVSVGDWHNGALTAAGQVLTWGEWSKGALGTWDSLPFAPMRPQRDIRFRGASTQLSRRGIRIGLAGAQLYRGVGGGGGHVPQPIHIGEEYGNAQARTTTGRSVPADDTIDDAESAPQDPWVRRLKERVIPLRGSGTPTRVHFDPEMSGKDFAFDIAFAGWHSSALTIDSQLIGQNPQAIFAESAAGTTEGQRNIASTRPLTSLQARIESVPPDQGSDTTISDHASYAREEGGRRRVELVPSSSDADTEMLQAIKSEQSARRICRISLAFLIFGIFTVFGGWEDIAIPVFFPNRHLEFVYEHDGPSYVIWPQSLAYFSLLAIPLVLYAVVARWTGVQIWRHS